MTIAVQTMTLRSDIGTLITVAGADRPHESAQTLFVGLEPQSQFEESLEGAKRRSL